MPLSPSPCTVGGSRTTDERTPRAIACALRRRGVSELAASLAAEAGIAVFRIAFERWISETSQPGLPQLIRESLDELKAVTAGK